MASPKCPECPLRAKYDKNPKSILGRLWKFHIKFCPGWKAYLKSLPEEEREQIKRKYS
ncbi:MAG: hypothetical protein R6V10_13530 [bacterium]